MRRPAACSWSDTSDDEETDEAGREPGEIVVEAPRDLEDGELPSASCAAEGECDVGEVRLTRRRRHLRLDVAERVVYGRGFACDEELDARSRAVLSGDAMSATDAPPARADYSRQMIAQRAGRRDGGSEWRLWRDDDDEGLDGGLFCEPEERR